MARHYYQAVISISVEVESDTELTDDQARWKLSERCAQKSAGEFDSEADFGDIDHYKED
jgi:hypothetical protein